MTTKYDKLDETFNITPTEVSVDETQVSVGVDREKPDRLSKDDITRDYEYSRGNLYSIIEIFSLSSSANFRKLFYWFSVNRVPQLFPNW